MADARFDPNAFRILLEKINDGDKEASDQSIIFLRKGTQWVQMDLGAPHELFACQGCGSQWRPRCLLGRLARRAFGRRP